MRKSGQITVFLSLVMLCVCSLVCGLVESARTAGAGWYLKMAADSAMDSVFSGYHRAAWVISQGAENLGWELNELFEKTILAMRSCENKIRQEMQKYEQ